MRPKRNPTVGARQFDDATFLLDASHSLLHELNSTGAFIWSLCDGDHPLDAIAEQLSASFEIAPRDALRDIESFVTLLKEKDLLTLEE